MSTKYPGGIISKTAPVPAGPFANGAAPGIWTLEQQAAYVKQGIWPIAGNTDPSAFIENLFSTYLYTGTGSASTITNGIDISGKGGLVWGKARGGAEGGYNHFLQDTVRGTGQTLCSNNTDGNTAVSTYITAFNTTGFTLGTNGTVNNPASTYVSWTFREQPKFFDVVTYTGDGSALKTISHNLGSVPGCMIIKSTSSASWNWIVYHRSLGISQKIQLNLTDAAVSENGNFGGTSPTSTQFSVGYNATNQSGTSYVAYLFAHNAGGFGLTGTDNVISCGSVVGASQVEVNLGYEPQWILVKNASAAQDWWVVDNMRGLPVQDTSSAYNAANLRPNLADAETTGFSIAPSSTGFKANVLTGGQTYIYIAIRRGPMKVPTVGTTVYGAISRAGTGTTATVTTGSFPPDLTIIRGRDTGTSWRWGDRLRGTPNVLRSNLTNAELTSESDLSSFNMNGFSLTGTGASLSNASGITYINYAIGRAPGFFDEVCYTGNGSTQTITHNLGVAPELIIAKNRGQAGNNWPVLFNFTSTTLGYGFLNTTTAENNQTYAYVGALASAPTSTTFSLVNSSSMNASGFGIVAYLFATCPGVSKVGSYNGTGTTFTVDCGFTGGARFVFIKRSNSTSDWYVWDTVRGMVSGTDPSLLFNTTDAEVNANSIFTITTGFQVVSTAAGINASGGTYIFLAIA